MEADIKVISEFMMRANCAASKGCRITFKNPDGCHSCLMWMNASRGMTVFNDGDRCLMIPAVIFGGIVSFSVNMGSEIIVDDLLGGKIVELKKRNGSYCIEKGSGVA